MNLHSIVDAHASVATHPSSRFNKLSTSIAALLALGGLITVSGCGKSERELTTAERLKSVATVQETKPDFYAPKSNARDYMKELREIRDNPKSEPSVIAAANKAIETGKNDPSRLAAAAASVVPATPPPAAAPTLTTTPTLTPAAPPVVAATPPVAAPVVTPPVVAPTPAPVAAAPRPAAVSTETRAVSREQPEFPREAAQRGIDSGTVRARAAINAAGEVTGVTILTANPARVFDRAVISAFRNWKFNAGTDNRTFDGEFEFKR
jgi:periplasmic protein TonB